MKHSIIFSLSLLLITMVGFGLLRFPDKQIPRKSFESQKKIHYLCSITRTTTSFDLDHDGVVETVTFDSPTTSVWGGASHIFVNNKDQGISVNGFYRNSNIIPLHNTLKILEVEFFTGQSINTLVYQYTNDQLIGIPVSTEHVPAFSGIVSRNIPEFKDVDNDGTLEMLAYYRYFPPEAKRTVEVYKFKNGIFDKQQEYEETTPEIYL